MKKKVLLFCVVICACFTVALTVTIQNTSNQGVLVLGNIEALSQDELADYRNKTDVDNGENCLITKYIHGKEEVTFGSWSDCEPGDDLCFRICFED
jgi:hypothetical protein